jgi:peptidoglycan glycosyltransferase
MTNSLRRLAAVVLLGFAVLAIAATYIQAVAGPGYRDDPRNLRGALARSGRERGGLITSDGVVIAVSESDPADPLSFRRSYPAGDLYAHIAGYSTLLFGDTQLEAAEATLLSSGRDATISGLLTALAGGDLRPRGLRLTLVDRMQRVAAAALEGQAGAVVVLDPATGAILAMVSNPGFDPNTLTGRTAASAGNALDEDPALPLLNRATSESYPPGSTFKVVTTAAALEAGVAGPETRFTDPEALELPGSTATISNFDGKVCLDGDTVTLAQAFTRSCNTIFGQLGMDVAAADLVATAEAFGFNMEIPLELDVLASRIPPATDFSNDLPALAQTAIGQRDLQATPLQMALVAAAIANGGEVMTPHLIAEVFDADGEVEATTKPEVWRRAVSPATAAVLTDLMERVVTGGTGTRAAVPGFRIAGKTGTAEIPEASPHAWFIGFGPVEPMPGVTPIAIAVLVESGGAAGENATGGAVAAPIARRVFAEWLSVPLP